MVRLKYKLTSDLRKLKSSGRLTMGTATSYLINYQNQLKALGVSININNINILEKESSNNQVEPLQLETSPQSTPCGSNQEYSPNIFEPHISLDLGEEIFENQFTQESQKKTFSKCLENRKNYINSLSNIKSYSTPEDEVFSCSDNINKESTHWGISADDIQSFIDDFVEDEQFIQSQVRCCFA